MTNYEKLRGMTAPELGRWICGLMPADSCADLCPAMEMCWPTHNGLVHWMGKEWKGEEDGDGRGV